MTPELMETLLRLEQVFMPHAQRQRRDAYPLQAGVEPTFSPPSRFSHYTSAAAAMGIINEKRIWMRNTNCMSDYNEVQHGFAILKEFFASENPDREALFGALDACAPGAATEAIALFEGWFQDTSLNTYITSLSKHNDSEDSHGRLSMWRAFGGNAARVAFILKVPYRSGITEALNITFSPVAYLSKAKLLHVLREVINNINEDQNFIKSLDRKLLIGMIFTMLIYSVTCVKHEGFDEEKEWRVIYSPKRQPSPLMLSVIKEASGIPQPI